MASLSAQELESPGHILPNPMQRPLHVTFMCSDLRLRAQSTSLAEGERRRLCRQLLGLALAQRHTHPGAPRWGPGNLLILALKCTDWPVPSPRDRKSRSICCLACSGSHN